MFSPEVLLFGYIPQGIATFLVGLFVFGLRKIPVKQLILFGAVYGLVDFTGRQLLVIFQGPELIGNLLPILYAILIYRFVFKIRLGISIASTLAGMILQGVGNLIMVLFYVKILTLVQSANPWDVVFAGFLSNIPLFLFTLVQFIRPIIIYDFSALRRSI